MRYFPEFIRRRAEWRLEQEGKDCMGNGNLYKLNWTTGFNIWKVAYILPHSPTSVSLEDIDLVSRFFSDRSYTNRMIQ
jgi:hypothetical protein